MTWAGKFGKSLALALALWCAGAGCLLVGYAQAATVPDAKNATAESEMRASEHSACHAKQGRKSPQVSSSRSELAKAALQRNLPKPGRSGAMSCCPLVSGSIATASRVQVNDALESASVAHTNFLEDSSHSSAPLVFPLRLPNQHHLYLRGCVFLI